MSSTSQERPARTLRKGILDRMMRHLPDSTLRRLGIFAHGEERISIHRDEPVFDGQYSNRCYQNAVRDAFVDFQRRATRIGRYDADGDPRFTEQWDRIIMHLPYAFQAKRMFPAVFHKDRQGTEAWAEVEAEVGPAPVREEGMDDAAWDSEMDRYRRAISKTEAYRAFHLERIEKGAGASSLIGNQYTGSIFLALMSTFESDLEMNTDLDGVRFGLCGYGSGAKAKVFEGIVSPRWREVVSRWSLFRATRRSPPSTPLSTRNSTRGSGMCPSCRQRRSSHDPRRRRRTSRVLAGTPGFRPEPQTISR